jgi:DNA-directed RNA polymerase subunit RPC12/RpoP
MAEIVCPYCFQAMVERPGWYICEQCGHTILRDDPDFKCRCQNCEALRAA